ncbi:MAG: hypothetical protein K0Q72_1686 [Armatimonadetes bacterium]|jgi:Tfp pilus assembly protein PilO|nr:hypothetical protein [Armatimonadota bacterium]
MKQLSNRERILVGVALLVAAFIVVDGLRSPTGGSRALTAARKKQQQSQQELERVKTEIADLQRQIDGRLAGGTQQALVQEMVLAAQSAARSAHVQLDDVKPSDADNLAGVSRVPVQIRLSARFPEAARFLYELERGPDGYHVDQVRLNATDPQSDQLDVELRMVAYVAGEKEKRDAAKS